MIDYTNWDRETREAYSALVKALHKFEGHVVNHGDQLIVHVPQSKTAEARVVIEKYVDTLMTVFPSVVLEAPVLRWMKAKAKP
jgi:hypothetical protein